MYMYICMVSSHNVLSCEMWQLHLIVKQHVIIMPWWAECRGRCRVFVCLCVSA